MSEQTLELIESEAQVSVITPMSMLDKAIVKGLSTEVIEKLMDLQERWEKNQGRKAFDNAMSNAKADIPIILKKKEVDFTSAKGRTNYQYEDLAGIAEVIDPILGKNGLSYRYRTTSIPNEPITVTCIISHRDGHSEENTLTAGRDDSGNKNSIQAIGSTVTYLQRYTLKAALGLASAKDNDAKDVGIETITSEQGIEIEELIKEVGADKDKFLKVGKLESIMDMRASDFEQAKSMLERKRVAK